MIETSEPMTGTDRRPPETAAATLRDAARAGLDEARLAAAAKADEAKAQAAGEIARTAHGLETAAAEMGGLPQSLLREAAGGLKQIAETVEGKNLGAMASDLSDFGRRNPMAYLGGAALVGFALVRFARAAAPAEPAPGRPFTGGPDHV